MATDSGEPDIPGMMDELKARATPVVPEDLNNQTLSDDPAQRLKQIEWQAQLTEQRLRGV